jgi:hypothetical protein
MNLTDNEIIKAFEEIIQSKSGHIWQDVLGLLNRQKAENEKNENIIRFADKTIEKQEKEIKRLHEVINGFEEQSHKELLKFVDLSEKYTDAKAEIERLQKEKSEIIKSYVDDEWN